MIPGRPLGPYCRPGQQFVRTRANPRRGGAGGNACPYESSSRMTRHVAVARRSGLTLTALALASALLLAFANTASAAIVPNVPMGSAANYSVLGGLGVSNLGLTTMHEDLGVSPGPTTAIT